MSATTTERRESTGIVGDALRRPIQEAVKEGVREAMQEEEEESSRGSGRKSRSGGEGGGGPGKFAMLALLGAGVAAIMLWRRRSGGSGGGMTESIREKSKTIGSDSPGTTETESAGPDYDPSETETGGGAIEGGEQSDESEDAAPEASSE